MNTFKNDPGIAGLVLYSKTHVPSCQTCADQPESPVVGAAVTISGTAVPGGSVALTTDATGYYQWVYKYTGKAVTFTVTLPKYPTSGASMPLPSNPQSVTLKSNGFLYVPFTIP